MRMWKGVVAGALALGGLLVVQGSASAAPMKAPELVQVAPMQTAAGEATAESCQWRRHGGWHGGYGWHPHYGWRPRYWHPYRPYGWHRPWGYHHYGWRRHFY